MTHEPSQGWAEEAIGLCSDLIRLDGQLGTSDERAGAEYVATFLDDLGIDSVVVESAPRRTSLIARLPGRDPTLEPLLIHTHLDVVPADPSEWSVHPLSGEVQDEFVWGRGAVDMKNMVASVLAAVKHHVSSGQLSRRPLVLAFLADEENAGVQGAEWLVRERPELFDGCRTAIGEGGGWSMWTTDETRIYPVHNAEKGWAAARVTARGTPGHASRINDDNPVRVLAEAIGRLSFARFPIHLTEGIEQLLRTACDVHGTTFDPDDPEASLALLGVDGRTVGAGLRNTAHPTRLAAGYQSNVIPSTASAELDCRYLPDRWHEFEMELRDALGGGVDIEILGRTTGLTPGSRASELEVMSAALAALQVEDPGARVSPYLSSGGTDATHFQQLGINCFGFSPVRLPRGLEFWSLFHGIDERVPVDSLTFSARVIDRFLRTY